MEEPKSQNALQQEQLMVTAQDATPIPETIYNKKKAFHIN